MVSITLHQNLEFSHLSVACIAKLYGMAKPFNYRRYEVIVQQGAEADGLYIMQDGIAKVSIGDDGGRGAILSLVRAGDLFGEIALIDGGRRMASVVALDDVSLFKVSKSDFMSLLAEHPELSFCLARYVCRRVRQADRKIGELALLGLQDRVNRQLRDLALTDAAGRLVIPFPLTQQDLADMVGASRERVSGVLRALANAGEILMDGRAMVLRPSGCEKMQAAI